jgi:large-conductance mechanosensitive channel
MDEQAAEAAAIPTPPGVGAGHPARIGFRNLRAVGITIAVAACTLVALCVASIIAPLLVPLVLGGAGFAAAKFYKSRAVEPLTPFNGATIGVMTGFWLFLMVALCIGVTGLSMNSPQGQEMLKVFNQKVPELAAIFNDPRQMVLVLLFWFFMLTVSSAFGGMLAARMQTRNGRPS